MGRWVQNLTLVHHILLCALGIMFCHPSHPSLILLRVSCTCKEIFSLSPADPRLIALSPSELHCNLTPGGDLPIWCVSVPGHLASWSLSVASVTVCREVHRHAPCLFSTSFISQICVACLLHPRHSFSCWDKAVNKTDQIPFLRGIYILILSDRQSTW